MRRALLLLAAASLPVALGGLALRPAPAGTVTFTPHDYRCGEADVVVIGNSKVESDIDPDALGQALGRSVVLAVQYGSNAPVWYAMLDNEVLAACTPDVVLVYGPIEQVLGGDVEATERVRLLGPHLDGDDPVLDAKVFGRPVGARARAVAVREAALSGLAAGAAGGRARLDVAFDRVFGRGWAPADRTTGLSLAPPRGPVDAADVMATTWEASFLPDFLARARTAGARVGFVVAPLPPSRARPDLDRRPGVAAIVARAGREAAWVDARPLGPEDAGYTDYNHMNGAGRARFTVALADALRVAGIGGAGATLPPFLDLLDAVTFTEAPPPLSLASPRPDGADRLYLLGALRPLADEGCGQRAQLRCATPLRAWVDGQLVSATTDGGELRIPAGGEPALDPARRGGGSTWLYPGDVARVAFTLSEDHPNARLALAGARVTGGGDLVVEWSSTGGARGRTPVDARRLSLAETLPVGALHAGDIVEVRLGPVDGYTLLTSLGLQ